MSDEEEQVPGTEDEQATGEGTWQREMKADVERVWAEVERLRTSQEEVAAQMKEALQSRPEDLTERFEALQRLQEEHASRLAMLKEQIAKAEQILEKNPSGGEGSPVARTDPPPPKQSRWL